MSTRGFVPGTLLGSILAVLLLCTALVACSIATSENPPAGTLPATSTLQSLPTTQSTVVQLAPTPTLPPNTRHCGSITISLKGPAGSSKSNDQAVGNCFWQDYQQCRSATMSFRTTSTDTITAHTFVLTKKGSICQITDTVQHITTPNHITSSTTYACAGLNKDDTRLIFNGCGRNGNIAVPLNQVYTPLE
ncbi:MAG: hypothetical protein J2P36_34695 [Ktedonobacteraceae bacterium]|nr:hypothetical protein [Ktedonobacteraceae bacterium]